MSAAWHRLRYFVGDAWDEWRHSLSVNLLALVVLVASLFVVGLLTLVIGNLGKRVDQLARDVRVDVYLEDDHTAEARDALREQLAAFDGVIRVDQVDKDEALRRYREWDAELAALVVELDDNPLPASLEIYLDPGDARAASIAGEIATAVEGDPAVEEVRFNRLWMERLESLFRIARVGGATLSAIVFGAMIFVMAGVLRLAVLARREEIEIMQLVGATSGFIRGPFLVTGFVQGLVAAGVALGLVELVRRAAAGSAAIGELALLQELLAWPLSRELALMLVGAGLAVSLIGSFFAVRRGAA